MDYRKPIDDADSLVAQGMYPQAVQTAMGALEQLLRDLFGQVIQKLPPAERATVTDMESKISGKGVSGFTLGQLVALYGQAKLFKQVKKLLNLDLQFLSTERLHPLVEIRNKATHEGFAPTRAVAQLVAREVRVFLEEAKAIEPEGEEDDAQGLTTSGKMLPPWMQVATPHDDIVHGELEMSTYAADLGMVARQAPNCPAVYREAERFFEATYMTDALSELLRHVLSVLGGGGGDRVLQLRTPFGGGKTHALIALYHLAASGGALRDAPHVPDDFPDPGKTRVAVLSCVDLDPSVGREIEGGPHIRTLWGELGWQLGGEEGYALVEEQDQARTAPGGDVLRELLDGQPTLVLIDETVVYVERAMTIRIEDSTFGRQALVFLQTLTEKVRELPHAAVVYSLQASAHEAVGDESLLSDLDHLVSRIDAKREPVSGDEVMRVVQRRLFKELGDQAVQEQVANDYAALYQQFLEGIAVTDADKREAASRAQTLRERILSSYPFHPDLLDLMYHRWGSLPSYQRTRGALQFLACAVHALWQDGASGHGLLGPGDIPLRDEATRSALFSQIGEREQYTSVVEADIIGTKAGAKAVDDHMGRESPGLQYLKLGTRLATAAFLYSFGARGGEARGVLEDDLLAGSLTPGTDRNVLASALRDLYEEHLLYLHCPGRRYRFEPHPNLNKLVADEAKKWTATEIADGIRNELAKRMGATKGVVLWPPDSQAVADNNPEFTMAYLGPEWAQRTPAEVQAGLREMTEHRGSVQRSYRNAIGFAVPARQHVEAARHAARQLLAIESLVQQKQKYQFSDEQTDELQQRRENARTDLRSSLHKLYETVWLPVRDPGGAQPYKLEPIDLRAQLTVASEVHLRVLEALRNWVFDSVKPTKIAALTNLGDGEGQERWITCERVVECFFSYLDFTKLIDAKAIQEGVSNGVEGGHFGYSICTTKPSEDAEPIEDESRLWFEQRVDATEIDLSDQAYLIAPSVAKKHVKAPVLPPVGPQPPQPPQPPGPGPGPEPPVQPPIPVGPGETGRRYTLALSATKDNVFKVFPALQTLSDKSKAMEVSLRVTAEAEDEFEQTWLRNAVEEPLDEANIEAKKWLEP